MCHADELHGLDIRLRRESFPLPTVAFAGKPSKLREFSRQARCKAAKLQRFVFVAFRAERGVGGRGRAARHSA
jgi:hypothetical protein